MSFSRNSTPKLVDIKKEDKKILETSQPHNHYFE